MIILQEFTVRQHHHFVLLEKKGKKKPPSDFINNPILLPCENYWILIANVLSSQKHVSALTEFVGIEHILYHRCITAFYLRMRKWPNLHTYEYWSARLLFCKNPFGESCTKPTGSVGIAVCYGKSSHFKCHLFAPHPFHNTDIAKCLYRPQRCLLHVTIRVLSSESCQHAASHQPFFLTHELGVWNKIWALIYINDRNGHSCCWLRRMLNPLSQRHLIFRSHGKYKHPVGLEVNRLGRAKSRKC